MHHDQVNSYKYHENWLRKRKPSLGKPGQKSKADRMNTTLSKDWITF